MATENISKNVQPTSNDTGQQFICDICGNVYANQTYLRRHKKDRHTEVNKEHQQCPKCSLSFKDLKTFWNHILLKHEAKYGAFDSIKTQPAEDDTTGGNKKSARIQGERNGREGDLIGNQSGAVIKRETDTSWVNGNTCIKCDKSFCNTSGLRRHLKKVHSLDWKLIQDRGSSYAIEESDAEILKSLEQPEPEFSCIVCNLEFKSSEAEIRHKKLVHCILPDIELPADAQAIMQLFSRKSNYRCKECGEKFRKQSSLEHHFLVVHRDRSDYLSCATCELEFTSVWAMARHKKNVHCIVDLDVPDEDGNYPTQCQYCPSVIIHKNYKAHVYEEHREHYSEVVKYLKTRDLENHPQEPATCKVCRKTFCDLKTLKRHVVHVHATRSREFACQECGKEFKDSGGLRDHLAVHQKLAIEPYVKAMLMEIFGTVCHSKLTCGICKTVTISSYEARIHVYIKHPDKFEEMVTQKAMISAINAAFPCPVCEDHFPTTKEVIRHIEDIHPDTEIPTCNVCGHKELKERDMNIHYQRFHPQASRHNCQICQASFKQAKLLRLHLKREHSGESLLCPYCPEKHVKLKLHVTIKHPDKAEEFGKLVKDAIREECQERMKFNELIDSGVPPPISKKKKKKRKNYLIECGDEDENTESIRLKEENEVESIMMDEGTLNPELIAPPVHVPAVSYKMKKKINEHLIEVHRLSPPPVPQQEENPEFPMEGFEELDSLTENDNDVKPSADELRDAATASCSTANPEPEVDTVSTASKKFIRIHLERLTPATIEKWKSPANPLLVSHATHENFDNQMENVNDKDNLRVLRKRRKK